MHWNKWWEKGTIRSLYRLEFSVKKWINSNIQKLNICLLFSHDEWIKLDRVIERKDSTNANTLFQQRPRRTSQINTYRQHLDSTNSNEQINQQQIPNSSTIDISSSSTLIDNDEQNKHSKSIHIDRHKNDESDIDDNSQGQSEGMLIISIFLLNINLFIVWNHVETISSTEDETFSYTSINRPNQSELTMDIISRTIRRSTSTNNNENIRNQYELIDDNDNEIGLIRDDEHSIIPKRRQSRAASSNNKVKDNYNISQKLLYL